MFYSTNAFVFIRTMNLVALLEITKVLQWLLVTQAPQTAGSHLATMSMRIAPKHMCKISLFTLLHYVKIVNYDTNESPDY